MTAYHGVHRRRPALAVTSVAVRPVLEQEPHDCDEAFARGEM